MKYIPVIGMEIHVELKTKSKMFCRCKNRLSLDEKPNTNICPVCSGQPGTLPVANAEAIKFVQLAGLALKCNLLRLSKFDRKNYFYPDLPKGYQISQYDQPLCEKGHIQIGEREIGITRIHMEEDTGKLTHPKGTDYSLFDLNRSGVPLMELVTEPDLKNGQEARLFCQKLQQIFRYLDISDADMEKGQMRCEVNISLHKENEEKLSGTKAEIKNLNSFRVVEKAIDFEIKRQTEILEKGEKVVQETRGWQDNTNETVSQRKKESAHDYRYFPEPDIPPMRFSEDYIRELERRLPELPDDKIKRLMEEYKISNEQAEAITDSRELAEYFENAISEIKEKIESQEIKTPEDKVIKLALNYLVNEILKHLGEKREEISRIKITPENYAEFIGIVADGKINSSAAQVVLKEMYERGADPSQVIEEKNLAQVNDADFVEKVVGEVMEKNPQSIEDYKSGKTNALQFLLGQTMKASQGKINPQSAREKILEKIK